VAPPEGVEPVGVGRQFGDELDPHRGLGGVYELGEEAAGEVGAAGQTDRPLGGRAPLGCDAVESLRGVDRSAPEAKGAAVLGE
jgi:hypothetical protein